MNTDTSTNTSTGTGARSDPRFTVGLVEDVRGVLEAHGYRLGDDAALAWSVAALRALCAAFEDTGADPRADPGADPGVGATSGEVVRS